MTGDDVMLSAIWHCTFHIVDSLMKIQNKTLFHVNVDLKTCLRHIVSVTGGKGGQLKLQGVGFCILLAIAQANQI